MEDSKSQDFQDDFPNKNIKKETIEIKSKEQRSISNINKEINENKDLRVNLKQSNYDIENKKKLEDNKKVDLKVKTNEEIEKDSIKKVSDEIIQGKTIEDNKLSVPEVNSDKPFGINDKDNNEIAKDKKSGDNKKVDLAVKSNVDIDKTKNNPKQTSTTVPIKAKAKPAKELPIEKKPFLEFVNDYLIPEIKNEFKLKGKEVNKINLQKTHRPIAEDICWVIYCEINDTCNFWLSFEKEDITSLKSFSLCKNYEKPSIMESFLIDEKKITLKLIISRILQRLNGQKLIGAN